VYNDPSAQRNTYTQAPAIKFDTPLGLTCLPAAGEQ
jgi:hypothetical protein